MTAIASSVTVLDATLGRAIGRSETILESDQRTNEFLATLAHELRNPLGPIKNGLQLLALMKLPADVEAVRMMMARQVDQLVHLVDNLEELHRGSVNAEGDGLNCGSAYAMQLRNADSPGNASSIITSPHSTCVFRVLVVDDLRAMRHVTEQLLSKLGHEVLVAENGKQALELLNSFEADVVISDITMPVMDGHDLARQIRANSRFDNVCLVALTGYERLSDREEALASGYDCHLTKPLDFGRLRDLFDNLANQLLHAPEEKTRINSG